MKNLLACISIAFVFLAVLLKLASMVRRRRSTASTAALLAFLLFFAVSSFFWIPAVDVAIPAAARLGRTVSLVAATSCALVAMVLIGSSGDQSSRVVARHATGASAVVLVILTLFVILPPGIPGQNNALEYVAISYFGISSVWLAHRVRTCSTHVRHLPGVTCGLRVLFGGLLIAVTYSMTMVIPAVLELTGIVANTCSSFEVVSVLCGTQAALGMLTITLITAGLAIPVVVSKFARFRALLGAYRSYRQLRPLWAALRSAFPNVVLHSSDILSAGPRLWQVDVLLYRRWVEVSDGLLLLHPSRPDTPEHQSCDPIAEANMIATALAALPADKAAAPKPHPPKTVSSASEFQRSHDYDSEIRWLVQVAAAFDETVRGKSSPRLRRTPTVNCGGNG